MRACTSMRPCARSCVHLARHTCRVGAALTRWRTAHQNNISATVTFLQKGVVPSPHAPTVTGSTSRNSGPCADDAASVRSASSASSPNGADQCTCGCACACARGTACRGRGCEHAICLLALCRKHAHRACNPLDVRTDGWRRWRLASGSDQVTSTSCGRIVGKRRMERSKLPMVRARA